jgi:hypothetical protein
MCPSSCLQPIQLGRTFGISKPLQESQDKCICGKQCNHAYTVGSDITLTAKPAKKHLFLGWSGACSGTALT